MFSPTIAVDNRTSKDKSIITIKGWINEDFNWRLIKDEIRSHLEINLSAVSMVNSVGMRNWVIGSPTEGKTVEYVETSIMFLQFLRSSRELAFNALLRSFYAPFACTHCMVRNQTSVQDVLITVSDFENLKMADLQAQALQISCKSCKREMSLSGEDPHSYWEEMTDLICDMYRAQHNR